MSLTILSQSIMYYSTPCQLCYKLCSLSKITLFSNLCNFYTLSLNNLTNPFANIPLVVAIKYTILGNLSYITRITFFSTTNSNLVIKSTIKCIYSFSSTLFVINFSTGISVLFFIL